MNEWPPVKEDEVVLILKRDTVVTMWEGPGGFLHFKTWVPSVTVEGQRAWKVDSEYVLGSVARVELEGVLALKRRQKYDLGGALGIDS